MGRAPGRHSGEARSTRVVRLLHTQIRGVTAAQRAPTSQARVRILAGLPLHDRRGPERLGYLSGERPYGPAVRTRAPIRIPRPRRLSSAAGRNGSGYRLVNREVAGSSPARSARRSGSSVGRALPGCTATTAAVASTAGRRGSGYLTTRQEHREAENLRPAIAGSPSGLHTTTAVIQAGCGPA